MIKLLKGNCLDLLRQLEPGCADLVLIDPPYSSGGLFAGDRKQDTRVKYTDADFNGAARFPSFSGDNMDQHSFIQFMTHVSMELRELTKEGGTIAAFHRLAKPSGHDGRDPDGRLGMAWGHCLGQGHQPKHPRPLS